LKSEVFTIQLRRDNGDHLIIVKVHGLRLLSDLAHLVDNTSSELLIGSQNLGELLNHRHNIIEIRLVASWGWIADHSSADAHAAVHAVRHALRW